MNKEIAGQRAARSVLEHVTYAIVQEHPMAMVETIQSGDDRRIARLSIPGHDEPVYIVVTATYLNTAEVGELLPPADRIGGPEPAKPAKPELPPPGGVSPANEAWVEQERAKQGS